MNPIKYSPDLAGFGKSRASMLNAIRLASLGEKVALVCPSIFLIRQQKRDIEDELESQGLQHRVTLTAIHSSTSEQATNKVFKDFVSHVEKAIPNEGEILLVTHHTFRKKNTLRRQGWTIIQDEEATVVEHVQVRMRRTHQTITPHLALKPIPGSSTHSELIVSRKHTGAGELSHRKQLELVASNPDKDAGWDIFGTLLNYVLDSNCRVITANEIWNNLLAGKLGGAEADFCCLTGPRGLEGYDDTTIACALFPYTINYQVWTTVFGAEFEESNEIKRHLRCKANHHPNSGQFQLYGAFAEPWSDYSKTRPAANGQTRMELLTASVTALFGSDEYAWCANVKDNPLPVRVNNTDPALTNRVPALPQGMNGKFEGYRHIAIMGAYNYNPFLSRCLEEVGVDREAQEVARNFLTWYQQMMRFMARDPSRPGTFRVVAPTARFGVWCKEIAKILPDCVLAQLPGTDIQIQPLNSPGRPKALLTAAEQAAKDEHTALVTKERNKRDYQARKVK